MKKQVLNSGSVELLDWMGGDKAIVRGGRICYQSQGNEQSDINLVKALVKNNHTSALEHTVFTFQVKAPIFVGSVPCMFVLLRSNYRETSRHQYQTDLGNSRAMRVVDD